MGRLLTICMGMILGTGGDDCVDMCASLFRVCGRYGARAQKSRDTNDPSGGFPCIGLRNCNDIHCGGGNPSINDSINTRGWD